VAWTGVILVDTAACDACKVARPHGDDEEQATRGNDPRIYKRATGFSLELGLPFSLPISEAAVEQISLFEITTSISKLMWWERETRYPLKSH
jgi:hypothetical protein